ncbi:MAG TPA: DUF4019 domain-containing protein [Polyangia bacterium]|nr:DUF4019 domain-containing protein [Polyangia bacterium]
MALLPIGCAATTPPVASLAPSLDASQKAALSAAESWLALIDHGKVGESWDGAASTFTRAVTRDSWKTAVDAVREPLGGLVSRVVKSAERKTSLPGAPDGNYVVIQFDTAFEKKKQAVETVTPMEEGGVWKVAGYFIR